MAINSKTLAYLKYDGELAKDGYMDIKQSADALNGFHKTLRYFLYQENPDFQNIEFQIPVKIEKGSWWANIPVDIQRWIIGAGIIISAAYLKKGAEKMAERDFENFGFKDIFKKAFKSIIWVIQIAKHFGTMHKRDFKAIDFINDNKVVKIKNDQNETLDVPIEYLEKYVDCPESLFSEITKLIQVERQLEIGLNEVEDSDSSKFVRITIREKVIFYKKADDEDILFPELKEGDYVEFEGHVTRGNENTNTIGFYYNGHVLTCFPEKGNVIDLKPQLFSNCLIKGTVDRTSKDGNFIEKRPRIKFSELILLDKPYPDLFSN